VTGRMTNIKLDEISLVDYPAHMVNGFPVIKSATVSDSDALYEALGKRKTPTMPDTQTDLVKALADVPVEDILKALAERSDVADIVKGLEVEQPTDSEDIYKGLPENVVTMLKASDERVAKAVADAEAAQTAATIEKGARLDREAVEVAKSTYGNLGFDAEKFAPAFRKFAETNPDEAATITETLKAVNAQADGTIFKELGTSAPGASGSPEAQINDIAKALVADGKAKNQAEAITKALADPENKTLVDAYFNGGK
jgi:DNA-binding transcriptional ArsR family regulator